MRKATSIEVLRSIAGIRLDGEPDAEGNDSEMDIDDAFRLLSDAVESARDALSRDPIEHVRILREALREIAGTSANENSEPDRMADALGEIQGIVHRALEATKEGA